MTLTKGELKRERRAQWRRRLARDYTDAMRHPEDQARAMAEYWRNATAVRLHAAAHYGRMARTRPWRDSRNTNWPALAISAMLLARQLRARRQAAERGEIG